MVIRAPARAPAGHRPRSPAAGMRRSSGDRRSDAPRRRPWRQRWHDRRARRRPRAPSRRATRSTARLRSRATIVGPTDPSAHATVCAALSTTSATLATEITIALRVPTLTNSCGPRAGATSAATITSPRPARVLLRPGDELGERNATRARAIREHDHGVERREHGQGVAGRRRGAEVPAERSGIPDLR